MLTAAKALTPGAGVVEPVVASAASAAVAGDLWRKWRQSTAMRKVADDGALWSQNALNGYRASAWKGRFGASSNLTYGFRGNTQYANLHVISPRMF